LGLEFIEKYCKIWVDKKEFISIKLGLYIKSSIIRVIKPKVLAVADKQQLKRRIVMKKLIIFSLGLAVIFMALSACDNGRSPDLEQPDFVPSYSLRSLDGNKVDLNVQYVQTAFFYNVELPSPTFHEVVSSKNEVEQYYQKHKRIIMDGNGNAMPDQKFLDAIAKYTDNYFANNFLLIVGITEGSGSIRHKVEIDENGNIIINRLLPKIGTADMAAWSLIMELNNSFKAEQYQVELVDIIE
jgi:hypothetical protein